MFAVFAVFALLGSSPNSVSAAYQTLKRDSEFSYGVQDITLQASVPGETPTTAIEPPAWYDTFRASKSVGTSIGYLNFEAKGASGQIEIRVYGRMNLREERQGRTPVLHSQCTIFIRPPTKASSITVESKLRGKLTWTGSIFTAEGRNINGSTRCDVNILGKRFSCSSYGGTEFQYTGEWSKDGSRPFESIAGSTTSRSVALAETISDQRSLPIRGPSRKELYPLIQYQGSRTGAPNEIGLIDCRVPIHLSLLAANGGQGILDIDITYTLQAAAKGIPANESSEAKIAFVTAQDSQSVDVTYDVTGTSRAEPISIDVFRSATSTIPEVSSSSGAQPIKLGTATISSSPDLSPGKHTVTILKGVDLPPDAKRPFVVAVAKSGSTKSSAYFQKWRLAALSHGFAGEFPADQEATKRWAEDAEMQLVTSGSFDKVINNLWIKESIMPERGKLVQVAKSLASRIRDYIQLRSGIHRGDVVDLTLIGHSRGAVLSCQVLAELIKTGKLNGWNRIYLLDPHPANEATINDLSFRKSMNNSVQVAVKGLVFKVNEFKKAVNDPEMVIPNLASIKGGSLLFQQTPCAAFDAGRQAKNSVLNLWGVSRLSQPGKAIKLISLSNSSLKDGRVIGHEEVHEHFFATMGGQL